MVFKLIPPTALRTIHILLALEASSILQYFYQQGALCTLTFKSLNSINNKPHVISAKCSPVNTVSSCNPFAVHVEQGLKDTMRLQRELIIDYAFILAKNPTVLILS